MIWPQHLTHARFQSPNRVTDALVKVARKATMFERMQSLVTFHACHDVLAFSPTEHLEIVQLTCAEWTKQFDGYNPGSIDVQGWACGSSQTIRWVV